MPQLTVSDLHFSRGAKPILNGISFQHQQGKVLTILGPSGCGKTTLLWLIAGLLEPARGSISFSDREREIGMVFQDGGLWDHLTASQHIEVVLRGRGLSRRDIAREADSLLREVRLDFHSKQRPGELSGGERQRLALARAIAIKPQWLLLDEPTSQLDGLARDSMVEMLAHQLKNRSAGVILATHQVDLALRFSDQIAVMHEGRIAQIGTPAEVYAHPANLAIAKMLGPAGEIERAAIQCLPPSLTGERIIARPHQLRFAPIESGPEVVLACDFTGACWHLTLSSTVIAASAQPHPVGTRGVLQWVSG
jgi:ABC-type Fe3+/spermidine/putrescine transport system ATPase subunit